VSNASDDLPDPDRPVNTTSLSRGIDSVTFLRLCSRAPRIVIWSVGIRTLRYSFSRVTANVALAVANQPAVLAGDPAFGHGRAPPSVDDVPGRAERFADLRGIDEVELQVEAHRRGRRRASAYALTGPSRSRPGC